MGDSGFRQRVVECVADIPPGRVMTYGDVAAACGCPGAARRVGAIAQAGGPGVPWQRVVRSAGRLAQTAQAGAAWQRQALATEGVSLTGDRIAGFSQRRWWPETG